jgi:hypothetical protein
MLAPFVHAQVPTQRSVIDESQATSLTAVAVEVTVDQNRRADANLHAERDRSRSPLSIWAEDLLALEAEVEAGPEDWKSEMPEVLPTIAWSREPLVSVHAFDRVLSVDCGHLVVSAKFGRGPPLA